MSDAAVSFPGTARRQAPVLRSAWTVALVGLPALVVLLTGYQRRNLSDDGLIYTRAVRQVLAGNGPLFNLGERAETSTSTLWQWLLVLVGWLLPGDVGVLAVGFGLLLSAVGVALAVDATRRLHAVPGRLLLPAGVLLPLALPPFWDYATSGLETGLQTFFLGAAWWVIVRCRSGMSARGAILAAIVIGLGPLVRPDLAVVTMAFLAVLMVVSRISWRVRAGAVVAAGVLPVAYEVFRAGYYGVLVPLPALTKEGSATEWRRGLAYLRDFVSPYWLYVPLLAVAALLVLTAVHLARRSGWRTGLRGDLLVAAAPVACAGVLSLYVLKVGGDYMHARMFLPALFLLVLPVLVIPARWSGGLLAAVVAGWAVLAVSPLRSPYDGGGGELTPSLGTQNIRLDAIRLTGQQHPVSASDWLSQGYFGWLPETVARAESTGRTLAHGPDGAFELYPLRADAPADFVLTAGYLGATGAAVPLDQTVADLLGLAYPLGAHMQLGARSLPGHEKPLGLAWLYADYGQAAPAVLPAGLDPAAVEAARRALACGQLRELQESVRAELTAARFWDNLVGSVSRTRLRIPTDPFVAEQQFCR